MKTRINVSMEEDVHQMIKNLAKRERTSVSAIVTRWTLERHDALYPQPISVKNNKSKEDLKAKSSRSTHA